MSTSVDLSSVDVLDMLERLEARNVHETSGGEEANFSCFGASHSHGDESPSAYMNLESTLWFCHGCKLRGNAVQLVMLVQNIAQPAAETWLRETYGIAFNEPIGGSMQIEMERLLFGPEEEPEPVLAPPSFLYGLRFDWAGDPHGEAQHYMMDRGFDHETLQSWDVGYDYMSERITIPVFDVDGDLLGVKARGWMSNQQPKYLILGDRSATRYGFQPYDSSHVVFGLHRARENKTAVLCEGELNAIALNQMGVKRPVATGMSYFSTRHRDLLVREVDEVVVFYDSDKAGQEGVFGTTGANGRHRQGVAEMLEPFVQVRIVQEPHGLDPNDYLQHRRAEEALELIEQAPTALALENLFG